MFPGYILRAVKVVAGSELVQGNAWLAGLDTDREEEEEESEEEDWSRRNHTVNLTRYLASLQIGSHLHPNSKRLILGFPAARKSPVVKTKKCASVHM